MRTASAIALICGLASVAPLIAAESTSYSRVQAVSGIAQQLNFHASAKSDCTAATLPEIKVVDPPRSGTLTIRKGEATIRSISNCRPFKAPAQAVFYQAKADFVGTDRARYQVISVNGDVDTHDITIEVKLAPRAVPNDRI